MKAWQIGLCAVLASGVVCAANTDNETAHAGLVARAKALMQGKHSSVPVATAKKAKKPVPKYTYNLADPKPPLNSYGAVDVKAHVPYSIQVPPVSASLQLPVVVSEAENWSNLVPPEPKLDAKSYILFDAVSDQILASYNPNKRLPPASITKLMLIYLLEHAVSSGQVQLNDKFTVPTVAWATGGSRMFLKPKEQVSVRNLISGMIVDSGNDAAVTVATNLGGTQTAFVAMMNHEARELGMTNTHFTDIMGLPAPAHYSSARDLAVLGSHIVRDYPQYLPWFKQKWFAFNGIRQPNFNKLLFVYKYATGLKTGSTAAAGYSLVSSAEQPNNPMRLVGVVLGTASRNQSAVQSKALLQYGFRNFRTSELYHPGQKVTDTKVLAGAETLLPVGVTDAFYATYPAGSVADLKAHVEIQPNLTAPIAKDQHVGTLVIKLHGKVLTTAPIYSLKAVKEGNTWQKLGDKVKSWWN